MITLPLRSSLTASFVLWRQRNLSKRVLRVQSIFFLTELTFLLVFFRFRHGRRGCSSSLEVFHTTKKFEDLTIWWKMREENDVYRYPERGSHVVLKATGRIYYLQCVFVKQKSARKNDGNRTLHFLWIKKCMFKLNVLYIS